MPSSHDNDDEMSDPPIGYGNPPKQHRFQPGKSGNPRGRPKARTSFGAKLIDELGLKVSATEGGKTIRVTKEAVIVKALIGKAMRGDVQAMKSLLGLLALHNTIVADQAALPTKFTLKLGESKSPFAKLEEYDD